MSDSAWRPDLHPDRRFRRYNGVMARPAPAVRATDSIAPLLLAMPRPPLPTDRAGEVALESACDLYHATLQLVSGSRNPARDCHALLDPLSRMVALQKSRVGQADCRTLVDDLRSGDHEGALEVCRRLIERETALLHASPNCGPVPA